MKFADPKNDLAFKKIFGDDTKTEILISLINSILGFTGDKKVVSVTIANPYQVPKIAELKETILDIKAVNEKGEHFIVEMQKKYLGDFAKRSLYYTSKAYVNQLDSGIEYSNLEKVYFIGILQFKIFKGDNYITRHLILNKDTLQQEIADFEFSFIELNKFTKDLPECESILDKWLYFIKNAQNLTMIPDAYKDLQEFLDAFSIAEKTKWNKKEMEVYDYIAIKEEDERNAIRTAINKGRAEGILAVAKSFLEAGSDIDFVSKATGISIEELNLLGS